MHYKILFHTIPTFVPSEENICSSWHNSLFPVQLFHQLGTFVLGYQVFCSNLFRYLLICSISRKYWSQVIISFVPHDITFCSHDITFCLYMYNYFRNWVSLVKNIFQLIKSFVFHYIFFQLISRFVWSIENNWILTIVILSFFYRTLVCATWSSLQRWSYRANNRRNYM